MESPKEKSFVLFKKVKISKFQKISVSTFFYSQIDIYCFTISKKSDLDNDRNGYVTYSEFKEWCMKISKELTTNNVDIQMNETQFKKLVKLQARIRQFICKSKYNRYKKLYSTHKS